MSHKKSPKLHVDQFTFDVTLFQKAKAELQSSVSQFADATERLLMHNRPAKPVIVPLQDDKLRKEVRRLVGVIVDQSGTDYHFIWDRAYLHMKQNYAFHAVEIAQRMGFKVHLDAVQHCNMLSALHYILLQMLGCPEYQKQVVLPQLAPINQYY